jgi:hypothetical protein
MLAILAKLVRSNAETVLAVNGVRPARVLLTSPVFAAPAQERRSQNDLDRLGPCMNTTKTALVAAVLSSLAALSMAQAPAAPAAAAAPMAGASKPANHPTKTGKTDHHAAKPANHPTKQPVAAAAAAASATK